MKFKNKTLSVVLCVALAVSIMACASFTKNAYRTLSVAGSTYDVGMRSAADLYQQGKITDGQKTEVVDVATQYRNAYIVAVDALVAYEKTDTAEDKDRVEAALTEFSKVSGQLISLLQKYIQ